MDFTPSPEEIELIKACIEKNNTAQKQLYEKYKRILMGVCLRYFKNREEAEDVLQETFMKIFNKIHTFRFECPLEGWIRKIAVNASIGKLQKMKNKNEFFSVETKEKDFLYDANLEGGMDAKHFLNLIQSMPIGYRTVFNLFAIEGYSHKEIGKMLNIAEVTSKTQYLRARARIQKMLVGEEVLQCA